MLFALFFTQSYWKNTFMAPLETLMSQLEFQDIVVVQCEAVVLKDWPNKAAE